MRKNDPMVDHIEIADAPAPPLPSARRVAASGSPPLIPGEDHAAYDTLLTRVCAAVKPADIFEEMWVGDIVGLEWDILRYRRLKARFMDATSHQGLRAVLEPRSFAGWLDLVDQWAARAPAAIEQVDQLLESAGLTQHTVMAETLRQNLDHIAQIELMTARAQVSRNNALREIELHRAMLGQKLRREVQQIEDAEYRTTDADSTDRNSLS
jgi:hypothetical protein